MNIYVEKKNEFTINIINILYPLINEGINTIYNKAKEVSKKENVLKMFQTFLKRIPKWQDETLTLEINRIKTNSTDFDLLNNLIKAAIKSNITILTYSPYKNNKINPEFYNKFDFKKFIHNIYIEIFAEAGLVGIFFILFLIYYLNFKSIKNQNINIKSLALSYIFILFFPLQTTIADNERKGFIEFFRSVLPVEGSYDLNASNISEIWKQYEGDRELRCKELEATITNAEQKSYSHNKITKMSTTLCRYHVSRNSNFKII